MWGLCQVATSRGCFWLRCRGFLLQWLLLWSTGARACGPQQLWPMDSVTVGHGLSFPVACGILVPRPGIETVSPALAVQYLTTGPPEKSLNLCFWHRLFLWLWCIHFFWVSSSVKQCPDGSAVKNLPAVHETRVQCLAQEDPLEEEMANPSSILAWKIPRTEESGGLQSMGVTKS